MSGLLLAGCAAESPYPHRPITLICPWGAGGGTDSVSRQVAAHLEREMGVPVSVVNATGGKGVVGHNRGFSARPDGYTLLMATLELNMLHWSGLTDLTYNECVPLMSVNEDYAALLVRGDAPWRSLQEIEDDIRSRPHKLTASGTANGGAWHLALAGWLLSADMHADDVVWISSTGAAPSLKELMSGGVDMVCCSLPEARTQMKNGDVRALGVMAPVRADGFAGIPTFREQGRDWALGGWRGVVAPQGTPPEVIARLQTALERVVTGQTTIEMATETVGGQVVREEVTFPEFMAVQGYDHTYRSADQFRAFLAETDEKFGALLTSEAMRSVNRDRYNALAFPAVLGALLLGVLALIGLQRARRTRTANLVELRSDQPDIGDCGGESPDRARSIASVALVVGSVALYAAAAETVGFVMLAGGLLWLLLWRLGSRWWICTAVTLLIVPATYQVFNGILRVPLPRGWWAW
jgi:tripartite-type tricarboxylate transporter receptor subunit TctC